MNEERLKFVVDALTEILLGCKELDCVIARLLKSGVTLEELAELKLTEEE